MKENISKKWVNVTVISYLRAQLNASFKTPSHPVRIFTLLSYPLPCKMFLPTTTTTT